MPHVAFFLTPNLHLLDLAGPAQVFSSLAALGHDYQLSYLAEEKDVLTAQGLPIRAQVTWPELGPEDLVIVPGWRSSGDAARVRTEPTGRTPQIGQIGQVVQVARAAQFARVGQAAWTAQAGRAGQLRPASAQWLFDHHTAGGTVVSVCSAASALGQAGLLDGRRCTTHHQLQEELARRYPKASVVRDVLYVVDDRVATSAGIASGIDLALHLVAVRHGPGTAAQVAREMVVYARRNGHEPQVSAMLRHRSHLSDAVHRVQDLIDARYFEPLPLSRLADAAGVSERTLTRLFESVTGSTPLRYQQLLRVEQAEQLISQGDTVDAAARAVGFGDARMLRRLRARA